MLMWIVPVSVFFLAGAIVLGGGPVTIDTRSVPRQILGLCATMVVYLLAWGALEVLLARLLPLGGSVAIASVLSLPMFPFLAMVGFRVAGVRTHRGQEQEHGQAVHG